MAAASETKFVTWDDFVRLRRSQDKQLARELAILRRQNASLRREQKEVKLDNLRMAARFDNYKLKTPFLEIKPVPAYDPNRVIVLPNPDLFPRHAKEFYALRHPSNDRQREMLSYLVDFYDIQPSAPKDGGGKEEARPNASSERAVEMLEGILGLDEDNLIKFAEQAAERRRSPKRLTTKRARPPALREHEADRRPSKVRRRQAPAEKIRSSGELSNPRWEWRLGTRSTPPSQRLTINNLHKAPVKNTGGVAMSALPQTGASSSTRPFTEPRKP